MGSFTESESMECEKKSLKPESCDHNVWGKSHDSLRVVNTLIGWRLQKDAPRQFSVVVM